MMSNAKLSPEYVFLEAPHKSGAWVIGGSFYVYVINKPCWLHKKMTKLLLGWDWQ